MPTALSEIARRFAPAAVASLIHIIHLRTNWTASAPEEWLLESRVSDNAEAVAKYLAAGEIDHKDHREVLAVYAADLMPGALALTDVTAEILRSVAAQVEADGNDLPRSLEAAFTRHGIPQPMAWVETEFRDHNDEHRQGPADCLDHRRAA